MAKAQKTKSETNTDANHAVAATKKSRLTAEKRYIGGFINFTREQGIVGLAIGLAIGTQANTTVKSIVESFINPIVGFLVGSDSGLTNDKWNIIGRDTSKTHYLFTLGNRQLVFSWGPVLSSLITLLAVVAVIYFVVKGLHLDRIDKQKEQ